MYFNDNLLDLLSYQLSDRYINLLHKLEDLEDKKDVQSNQLFIF